MKKLNLNLPKLKKNKQLNLNYLNISKQNYSITKTHTGISHKEKISY